MGDGDVATGISEEALIQLSIQQIEFLRIQGESFMASVKAQSLSPEQLPGATAANLAQAAAGHAFELFK